MQGWGRSIRLGGFVLSFFLGLARLTTPAWAGSVEIVATKADGPPLANTVVTLRRDDAATTASDPPRPSDGQAVITQRDRRFIPHVRVIRAGTSVRFPNEDDIKHHVYSFSKPKQFQLRLYGKDEVKTVRFDTPGIVVLGCNIHDHMLAYVFITQAPYFAKTDEMGRARIADLPAGRYRAEV